MTKHLIIALAILSLSLPTAARAEEAPATADTPGYITPLPVRYELAHRLAMKVCPLMDKVDRNMVATKFRDVKRSFGLTENELTIVINACIIYVQGGIDTTKLIKSQLGR